MGSSRRNPRSLVTSRKQKLQKPRLKHYLVLEGEVTEKEYFEAVARIRESNYELEILAPGSARHTLFENAVKILDLLSKEARQLGRGFSHSDVGTVWIVCDVDDEGAKLKELLGRPQSTDIKWIISNPSFDAWLGMHFTSLVTGYTDRHKIQSKLKEMKVLTGPNSKTISMELLKDLYASAKKNAQDLDRRHDGVTEFPENNPSSNVPELVDILNPDWK